MLQYFMVSLQKTFNSILNTVVCTCILVMTKGIDVYTLISSLLTIEPHEVKKHHYESCFAQRT